MNKTLKLVIILLIIAISQFYCYSQDSLWAQTIEKQDELGINNLIQMGLENEIDGINALFPIWIKGKNDKSFVIVSEKTLHLLYNRKFNQHYYMASDACVQFCKQLFQDSITTRDLSMIFPPPIEDYVITPTDSIFLYPDSLKKEFVLKVFSSTGELNPSYNTETSILKLFHFGYLLVYCEGTRPPVISLYPKEFITTFYEKNSEHKE